jgi:hypothetical protein
MCVFTSFIETFKPAGTSTQSSINGTRTANPYFPTVSNNMMDA